MRLRAVLLTFALLGLSAAFARIHAQGLSIFFVDTEGGAATLIVTPAGESVLIDTGNPGGRDAGRIARTAKDVAGLSRIDHLVITHWHVDHFGGAQEIEKVLPVGRFYDHGPTVEPKDFEKEFAWYLKLSEGRRTVLKPGDAIPLKPGEGGRPLKLLCVAGHRAVPAAAAANPTACKDHPAKPEDTSDNAASLGLLLSWGDFQFLDCGDLTWNVEHALACPANPVGGVDVYQVNHHGLDISNNPALVNAVKPRVAIMNNGPRKGGDAAVLATLGACPGLDAVFQMHRNVRLPDDVQAPRERTANRDEACAAEIIRLDVAPDAASYTVTVGSKGKPERFETR